MALKGLNQMGQPLRFDNQNQLQKLTQMPGRKGILSGKPQQILLRQINEPAPLIFAKRHLRVGDFNKLLFLHLYPQQAEHLGFVNNGNTQLLGFRQFGTCRFARNHQIGFFRYAAGDFRP
ncbi:hypothetical protein ACUY4Q_001363 [Phytobacter sp. AG2a]